jgi:hypothetical protein
MVARSNRWLKLFEKFSADLRIKSKEAVTQDDRGAKLDMWDSQKRFMRELGQGLDEGIHTFNALKSRQLGITTISLALVDVFWPAMHPNMIGCLVTDTEKNREANRALIEGFINSFPDDYFGESFRIVKANRQMMAFSNGSRLDLLVAGTKKKSTSWGEGIGYAYAHMTEIGSYGDVEGLKSLEEGFAQSNPNRLFVYESTAKGMNHWRTKWMNGLNDLTQRSFFIGWWANPNNAISRRDPRFAVYGLTRESGEEAALIKEVARLYNCRITPEQLAWIRWKENQAGAEQDLLDQNQPWTANQAFVQTGYSFFQTRVLGEHMKRLQDDPPFFVGYRYEIDNDFFHFRLIKMDSDEDRVEDVELKIWEEPVEDAQYVIGCDPAYGRNDHKDHHNISVFRCFADRIVQVADYTTAESETKHCAWVLFHLCGAYRNCMANVELGGPGRLIMSEFDHLRQLVTAEINKDKTAMRNWEDAFSQSRWFLYHKVDSIGAGYVNNFETNYRTKMELLYGYRGAFTSGDIVIRSGALLREMSIVVDNDGDIGAPESKDEDCKDDRVFGAALAVRAWHDWIRKDMLAQGLTYDVVMKKEQENASTQSVRSVNQIVFNFFKNAEERANVDPEPPKWMSDAGLA